MRLEGSYYTQGLEILDDMTDEELLVLRDIYLKKGGSLTSTIELYEEYKDDPNHPTAYVDLIRKELREYGSNTFHLEPATYKEVLCKVCDKMNVNYNKARSIEHIEENLLEKVLTDTWENMSKDEKDAVLNKIGKTGSMHGLGAGALVGIFRVGGFASYQLVAIVANMVVKMVLGRGLSIAANAALIRAFSFFAGPIGLALTAAWTIVDIAGPAYRVIVPAVIYIAAMRRVHNAPEEYKNVVF